MAFICKYCVTEAQDRGKRRGTGYKCEQYRSQNYTKTPVTDSEYLTFLTHSDASSAKAERERKEDKA